MRLAEIVLGELLRKRLDSDVGSVYYLNPEMDGGE